MAVVAPAVAVGVRSLFGASSLAALVVTATSETSNACCIAFGERVFSARDLLEFPRA